MLHVVTTGAYYPPVVTTRAHICHEYHEFYLSRGEMSALYTVPNLCGEKSVQRKYVWRKNDRSGYNMEDLTTGTSYLTTGTLRIVTYHHKHNKMRRFFQGLFDSQSPESSPE